MPRQMGGLVADWIPNAAAVQLPAGYSNADVLLDNRTTPLWRMM
jgi:hypothetical protein